MILIKGIEIVDDLCLALESRGRPYRRVDTLDARHAWELQARTIVLVEPLPRVDAAASASECGLRELISAASAPGVRSAIIVTPRPDADAELRMVRRSGIPYTILRPLPLVESARDPAKPTLVPRELAAAPAAAVTADMIVDAVIDVIERGACGQTLEIAPPPTMTWSELLARAGVTPKPVARWKARVGRWFGAHTFDAPLASCAP